MKKYIRTLPFLLLVLLVGFPCNADPLNGGITTEDILAGLLPYLLLLLIFIATPILSYLAYKRSGKKLNKISWVLAIIAKFVCIVLAFKTGSTQYSSWVVLISVLPNISLYLLLLKAEQRMIGWQFQLASFIHSILGIQLAGTLLSILLVPFLQMNKLHIFMFFVGSIRFCASVWFIYQYLKLANSKGIYFTSMLYSFVCGIIISLGLFLNNISMLLVSISESDRFGNPGLANTIFSMPIETVFLVATAIFSGAVAYWLYSRKQISESDI